MTEMTDWHFCLNIGLMERKIVKYELMVRAPPQLVMLRCAQHRPPYRRAPDLMLRCAQHDKVAGPPGSQGWRGFSRWGSRGAPAEAPPSRPGPNHQPVVR